MEKLVGYCYPHARGEGLDLCNKLMTFAVLVDDQIDGNSRADSRSCSLAVQPFLDTLHANGQPPARSNPLCQVFGEILRESRAATSPAWWARAAADWEYYFHSVVHERNDPILRGSAPGPVDVYLEIRRGTGVMGPMLDILEPGAGFEAPPLMFHSPQLRLMRRLVVDMVDFLNDVFSLEKEIARGEHSNIVLVLQAARNLSLVKAEAAARSLIQQHARRFLDLKEELSEACLTMSLEEPQRGATLQYADALEMWVAGFEPWQRQSPRYLDALSERPPDGPWARDDLLGRRPAGQGANARAEQPSYGDEEPASARLVDRCTGSEGET
ncbi:terpene synthase family protein [Streptomyces noursei]|uniref:terpene synthase family protein n=1 Tax=Streptomyces noursei TaxID=1971 RepID=UPI0023B789CA|nr:hypothetical protein [Streptomyces noursei]